MNEMSNGPYKTNGEIIDGPAMTLTKSDNFNEFHKLSYFFNLVYNEGRKSLDPEVSDKDARIAELEKQLHDPDLRYVLAYESRKSAGEAAVKCGEMQEVIEERDRYKKALEWIKEPCNPVYGSRCIADEALGGE